MPFIVNGEKLNKPIYRGNILNAIHVWLQNHWTGTPNASPSTLSQDGLVVATNLLANPGFESGRLNNWTELGGGGAVSISNYNAASGTYCAKISRSLTDLKRLSQSINLQPGTYHMGAHMFCSSPPDSKSPYATLLVRLDDNSAIWTFSPTQFGSWFWHDEAFTIPPGRTARGFELWTNTAMAANAAAFFDDIILCTQSDWQAMQARGIRWFDGDSYQKGE